MMMRTKILFILSAILITLGANAQRFSPGGKGLVLSYGECIVKDARLFQGREYGVGMELTQYLHRAHYWAVGAEYQHNTYWYRMSRVPVDVALLSAGYYRNMLDVDKTVMLYFGARIHGGYEYVNEGKAFLPDGAGLQDKSSFVYGLGAVIRVESCLTDNFSIIGGVKLPVYFGSDLNLFRPAIELGIKLNY